MFDPAGVGNSSGCGFFPIEVSPVPDWVWYILAFPIGITVFAAALGQLYYRIRYLSKVVRIFEEKPLFIIPRGKPADGAEDVTFETTDGLALRGCYLPANGPRKGVILFGLEFGSNRWAAVQYCSALREVGYDVFAYEPRSQGESDKDAAYDPLQWVTNKDLADGRAALAYLKRRKDAPVSGIGIFGISKGGSVGLLLAAEDAWVKCVATDGAYATYSTMVPYMQRWVHIYVKGFKAIRKLIVRGWFYGQLAKATMKAVGQRRNVQFLSVEKALKTMTQPLLLIHGSADTYIKSEMAQQLLRMARPRAKDLWLVPGAKHNQALNVAGQDYHKKLVEFFDRHMGEASTDSAVSPSTPPTLSTAAR